MNNQSFLKPFILVITFILLLILPSKSQDINADKLKIFIDCSSCDIDFIKQEINYLSYVRDRLLSDVHLQVLSQNTGSGGEEYTLYFFGQNDFSNQNDTLVFTTNVDQTSDEVRKLQMKSIQLGLVPFLIKKGYWENLNLTVTGFEEEVEEGKEDVWNNWVYSISGSSRFNGQESTN